MKRHHNFFRRIFLSIREHKKDTILTFLVIFVLSFFVSFCYTFYVYQEELNESLLDKTIIGVSFNSILSENHSEEWFDDYFIDSKFNDFDKFYSSYKNALNNCFNKTLYLRNFDSILSSNLLIYNNMTYKSIYSNDENISEIYNFDKTIFDKEGYVITEGHYLDDNDKNSILVSENLGLSNGEYYENVSVGDTVILINSLGEEFYYEIVGIFKQNDSLKKYTSENKQYGDDFMFMLPYNELINISSIGNDLSLTKPFIQIEGNDNKDKILNYLKNSLNGIVISDDDTNTFIDFYYEVDDELSLKLIKPIENLKKVFKVVTIIIILVLLLLLYNLILYAFDKRKRDFGIFISLGQSKFKTIFEFLFEILIIASLSFVISLPFSYMASEHALDYMAKTNLERQAKISKISGSKEENDIFSISDEVYSAYQIDFDVVNYLIVYTYFLVIIVFSASVSFIKIALIKPKDLLKH